MPIYKINESADMLITEGVVSDILRTLKTGASNIKNKILDLFKSKLEKGCDVYHIMHVNFIFDKRIVIDEAYCDPRALKLFVRYVKESEKLYDELGDIFGELEKIYKASKAIENNSNSYNDIKKIMDKAEAFSKKCKRILEDGIGAEFEALKDLENIPVDARTVETYVNRYRKAVKKLALHIESEYEYEYKKNDDGTVDVSSRETEHSKNSAKLGESLQEIGEIAEEYLGADDERSPKAYELVHSIKVKGKYEKK